MEQFSKKRKLEEESSHQSNEGSGSERIEVPPPQLQFLPKPFSVVEKINHAKFAPRYGGTYGPGDLVRFEIPSQDWIDPSKLSLSMRVSLFTDAANTYRLPEGSYHPSGRTGWPSNAGIPATDFLERLPVTKPLAGHAVAKQTCSGVRVANGIQTLFNRVKLLQGSKTIEDIQHYNQLNRALKIVSAPDNWRHTTGNLLEGYINDIDPYEQYRLFSWAWEANGHLYNVSFHLGLFNAGKYLPTSLIGQLTIELYLETAKEALVSTSKDLDFAVTPDAANDWEAFNSNPKLNPPRRGIDFPDASYRIHDMFLHVHFVIPNHDYHQAAVAQVQEKGMAIFYNTWQTTSRQITSPGNQTLSFQQRALSVKGCVVVMRNSNTINQIDNDCLFSHNFLSHYQWRIGGQYWPAQDIEVRYGGAEAYTHLLQGSGSWGDIRGSGGICAENFSPSLPAKSLHNVLREYAQDGNVDHKFVMVLDLEKTHGQISGFNTISNNVDIELLLQFDEKASTNGAGPTTGYDTDDNNFQAVYSKSQSGYGNVPHLSRLGVKDADITRYTAAVGNIAASNFSSADDSYKAIQVGVYEYKRKDAATYVQFLCFTHIDAVLKITGIGNVAIEK